MANVMICDVCGDVVRERKAVATLAYERGLNKEWDLCDVCARKVEVVLRKDAALGECRKGGRGFPAEAPG